MPTAAPRTSTTGAPIWLGMLVLYVVWGSTYLGIAIAVDSIPPFLMAATRFLLAGLILLTWSVAREGRSFVVPSRREIRDSAIVGALLLGGGMGFVAYAEQTVPSGIAALLIATMPIWVAVLGGIFLGERLPRLAAFGVVVGFAGVAILAAPSIVGGVGRLRAGRPALLPDVPAGLGDRIAVRVAPGEPAGAAAGRDRVADAPWRDGPVGHGDRDR